MNMMKYNRKGWKRWERIKCDSTLLKALRLMILTVENNINYYLYDTLCLLNV